MAPTGCFLSMSPVSLYLVIPNASTPRGGCRSHVQWHFRLFSATPNSRTKPLHCRQCHTSKCCPTRQPPLRRDGPTLLTPAMIRPKSPSTPKTKSAPPPQRAVNEARMSFPHASRLQLRVASRNSRETTTPSRALLCRESPQCQRRRMRGG